MKRMRMAALCASFLGGGPAFAPVAGANVIVVRTAPPPPRDEAIPAARRGHLWTPGFWHWNGERHIWVKGKYVRARQGYYWREPAWAQLENGGWRLERGRWERASDGVPNRAEAPPAPPYRP